MPTEVYEAIPRSDGKLEIQSLPYVWSSCTDIIENPVVGDRYYDPNTGKMSSLIGQTQYENITVTGLLSKTQFLRLDQLYNSPKAKDGSLTATHVIGNITSTLTGVRLLRKQHGGFDKTSNSPAEVQLEFSFTGVKTA